MIVRELTLGILFLTFIACSYNPFSTDNHLSGNIAASAAGGAAGVGAAALLNSSTSTMALAGLSGATIGYYVTTQHFAGGNIYQAGGQVYQLGDYVGIDVPTDQLFEPNTATLLPQAPPVLSSIASITERYPDNNILISGNTSGFASNKF